MRVCVRVPLYFHWCDAGKGNQQPNVQVVFEMRTAVSASFLQQSSLPKYFSLFCFKFYLSCILFGIYFYV